MKCVVWPLLLALACEPPVQSSPSPQPPAPPPTVAPSLPADSGLPPGTCSIEACNKLERFSLNPLSHMKDAIGETCFDAVIAQSLAKVGTKLDAQSRWWQGKSINPTKQSVTRVAKVYACAPEKISP